MLSLHLSVKWITLSLQKLNICEKQITHKFNKKDPILNDEFHNNYKKYRNLLSTFMKKSKQAYYDKYFETNWNNVKNTWKGIKFLISVKTVASSVPTVLSLGNDDTTTNPYDIVNTFNYFTSTAETTEKSIKYSDKHFKTIFSNKSGGTIFLQPTDKEEIANIMYSLNSNKASGPNSIPYRIILPDLFNLCFMTGVFPSVFKPAKVVPVFKKNSKLDCSNYHSIY